MVGHEAAAEEEADGVSSVDLGVEWEEHQAAQRAHHRQGP